MSDGKAIARVEKLLRLAAPSSNTSEAERASAALEAAKLIAQHNLVVVDKPPPMPPTQTFKSRTRSREPGVQRPRSRPASRPFTARAGVSDEPDHRDFEWYPNNVIDNPEPCQTCGGAIWPGETAWFNFNMGYRHLDCEVPSR